MSTEQEISSPAGSTPFRRPSSPSPNSTGTSTTENSSQRSSSQANSAVIANSAAGTSSV